MTPFGAVPEKAALVAALKAWAPKPDDRVESLLEAEAGRRGAERWNFDDCENVIAFLLTPTPSTPVQSAGEAFHETGVLCNVSDREEVDSLRAALIAMGRMMPGVVLDDRVSSAFLAKLPDEMAHYHLHRAPPAPVSEESDRRDLDEMLAAWRASLANPSTWVQRLRDLLSPAPASVADHVPDAGNMVADEARASVMAMLDQWHRHSCYPDAHDFELRNAAEALLALAARPGGEVREALIGLLAWAESIEDKMLVGNEGCLWPVEAARDALRGEVAK